MLGNGIVNKEKILENYATTQYNTTDFSKQRVEHMKSLLRSLPELRSLPKSISILELGSGMGTFTHTCKELDFKNYTGVDLSEQEISIVSNLYSEYKFCCDDIIHFLKLYPFKYDLIYMNQVFEHLTLEQAYEILPLIYEHLTPNGKLINIFPNANAYYHASGNRYNDITHQQTYTEQSIKQLFRVLGYNNFEVRNTYVGHNKLQNLIHKSYLAIFNLHLKLLGFAKWDIYTRSMITILEKNNDC